MDSKCFNFKSVKLLGPQSIRVLTLQASQNPNSELIATLKAVNLVELKPTEHYEALSWAWGSEEDNRWLFINEGKRLARHAIRRSLEQCLRRLRDQEENRVLWVGAICIDQKTSKEKNQQVAIMREIYRRAKGTIIWLGEASPQHPPLENDLKATFVFIQDSLLKRGLDQITKDPNNIVHWENLQAIMMKPWFNRRWVIQEIALAQEATVYCGQQVIPWKEFSYAVSLFVDAEPALQLSNRARFDTFHRAAMFSEIGRTGAAELTELQSSLFRSSIQGPQSLATLEFLVSRLPMFECGTAHDAIYALLAVARDTAPHSGNFWDSSPVNKYLEDFIRIRAQSRNSDKFQEWSIDKLEKWTLSARRVAMLLGESFKQKSYPVTYEADEIDVYVHFMETIIKSSGSLDMICRPWAPRVWARQEEPDDDSDTDSSSDDDENEPLASEKKPIRLPSWIQDRSKRAFCSASTDDGRDLERIVRRNADPLVGLPGRSMYSASGGVIVSMRTVSFRRRSENDHSLYVKGFVIGTVDQVEVPAVGGNVPRSWLTFGKWRDLTQDPPPELCRTLIANREPSRDHAGSTPPSYYDMVCKRILAPAFQKNSVNIDNRLAQTQDILEQRYLRRMRAVITERVLFRMKGKKGIDDRLALGTKPSRTRHASDAPEADAQLASHNRGVRDGDAVCILYGCSVPVVMRRFYRKKDELEQERAHWQSSFARRFFRGIVRMQRIFQLRQAIKTSRKADDRRRRANTGPDQHVRQLGQVNTIDDDLKNEREVRKRIKRITESLEKRVAEEKQARQTEEEQALENFRKLSADLCCLPSKHPHGTSRLGKALKPEGAGSTRTDRCEGASPTGKHLVMPNMPMKNPDPKKYYELIGECYIDSLMDGEALEARSNESKENPSPEDIFDEILEIR